MVQRSEEEEKKMKKKTASYFGDLRSLTQVKTKGNARVRVMERRVCLLKYSDDDDDENDGRAAAGYVLRHAPTPLVI